ncbi:ClpX C4-type zinc finger protein [Yersinia rohdei]|uniref:ClpX C4-type zinc finger protein n=1 Tax=Yersinia rohdei TaxID=29485 RepID=UPI0025AA7C27|nr:ClpX C4-type zinc finger protein [Yersinia rohdei]MDN0093950.1 ClpX C4-type zinc finger protein [Yersinia rohdei]
MMANNIKIDFAEWKFKEAAPEPSCSFCKKPESEVRIITGPAVNICNECVGLCNEILDGEEAERRKATVDDLLSIYFSDGKGADVANDWDRKGMEAIYDAGYRKPKE